MIRVCVDCGRQFEITPGEERFYKSKDLDLPKRCKPCRDKKRSTLKYRAILFAKAL